MKLIKTVLIAALVLVLGWYAWSHLPGLRTRVRTTVDEYGGWTEEARREDPVGFIEFAEKKLTADLEEFRESQRQLGESRSNASDELARNTQLSSLADQIAGEFKSAFQTAESSGSWPVTVRGASYDRGSLVEQVERILADKATYQKVIGIYQEVIDAVSKRGQEIRDRIQSTEATLHELRAKKELVRVEKLTADADELLAQVDELLGGNRRAIDSIQGPVRSIEELMASAEKPEEAPASKVEALDYLESE